MIINELPDGLYRVCSDYFCAGFMIKDGKVTDCAPILRKNLHYWAQRGQLVVQDDHVCDRIDQGKGA